MDIQSSVVHQQLVNMLKCQEELNTVFDPQWRVNRHAYLRAAMVEGAEMIDHHGFKWWKKQEKNLTQVQLEMIDIAHFMLSEVTSEFGEEKAPVALIEGWLDDSQEILFDGRTYVLEQLSTLEKMDLMVGLFAAKRISWSLFRSLMKDADLSFSELHKQYAAKNVLNLFRQKNGYKEGTYAKVWQGLEDNEHLANLMKNWKEHETMNDLYTRLEALYSEVKAA